MYKIWWAWAHGLRVCLDLVWAGLGIHGPGLGWAEDSRAHSEDWSQFQRDLPGDLSMGRLAWNPSRTLRKSCIISSTVLKAWQKSEKMWMCEISQDKSISPRRCSPFLSLSFVCCIMYKHDISLQSRWAQNSKMRGPQSTIQSLQKCQNSATAIRGSRNIYSSFNWNFAIFFTFAGFLYFFFVSCESLAEKETSVQAKERTS